MMVSAKGFILAVEILLLVVMAVLMLEHKKLSAYKQITQGHAHHSSTMYPTAELIKNIINTWTSPEFL